VSSLEYFLYRNNYNPTRGHELKVLIQDNLIVLNPKNSVTNSLYSIDILYILKSFIKNQKLVEMEIKLVVISTNLNYKINIATNIYLNKERCYFISLGSTIARFNILQKSLRRNKKYVSLLMNSIKSLLNNSIYFTIGGKKNLNTKVFLFINGPNQLFYLLKDLSTYINNYSNQCNNYIYINPLIKNSNNYFKRIKAIKKRIKKKLIKKFYKN